MRLHSQQDVVALIDSKLRRKVVHLERDTVGASHAVYFATLAAGADCVVRVSCDPDFYHLLEQEVWAATQCRERGVPVPEILAYEMSPSDFPEPYMIMPRVAGTPAHGSDLTAAERQAILEQLGHYLSLIHSITLPGFGWLIARHGAFAGQRQSWWEHVQAHYDREAMVLPADVLPRHRQAKLRERLEQERSIFALGSASLVHGDYHFKNILVHGATVTGLVDFENLVAGDPVFDFTGVHFRSSNQEKDLSALQRGYGSNSLFDDVFMKKLFLYEILLALAILWWKCQFQDAAGIAVLHRRLRNIEGTLDAL